MKQPKALQTHVGPQRVKRCDALIKLSCVTVQQVCFTLNHYGPMRILILLVGTLGDVKHTEGETPQHMQALLQRRTPSDTQNSDVFKRIRLRKKDVSRQMEPSQ